LHVLEKDVFNDTSKMMFLLCHLFNDPFGAI
jgi:hypothetical protein